MIPLALAGGVAAGASARLYIEELEQPVWAPLLVHSVHVDIPTCPTGSTKRS